MSLIRMKKLLAEGGQSLALLVILIMAFLALLALVLDGGFGLAQRRAAQNAADAGALAGADVYCRTDDPALRATAAWNAAWEYAVDQNEADWADISIDSGVVTVNTRITFPTTFGQVFGTDTITATASAQAGCFCPGTGEGVLPVAWSCRQPGTGAEWDPDIDCDMVLSEQGASDQQIYLIMDSIKLEDDPLCLDPPNNIDGLPIGAIDCDLDDDGINDLLGSGMRSWLDLDRDSSNAAEMVDWIRGTEQVELSTHTWLRLASGTSTSVFQAAELREDQNVILPVFDQICDVSTDPDCPFGYAALHTDPADVVYDNPDGKKYVHINSLAVFHITCVGDTPSKHCWAKDLAVSQHILDHNDFTIEGYFVRGYIPGLSGRPGDCVDAGAYTIYLTR